MKKYILYRIISILGITASGFIFAGWADNPDEIIRFAENVKTVRAEFVQEKHLKILSKPLLSKGVLYYQAPKSLRWEYLSPVRNVLIMRDNSVRRYIVRDNKIIEDSSANLQAMQIVFGEIVSWIQGRFFDHPHFITEIKEGGKIVLIPKSASFSKMIHKIELTLSQRPGILKSVLIYEDENSFTKLEFKNAELNPELNRSLFKEI